MSNLYSYGRTVLPYPKRGQCPDCRKQLDLALHQAITLAQHSKVYSETMLERRLENLIAQEADYCYTHRS